MLIQWLLLDFILLSLNLNRVQCPVKPVSNLSCSPLFQLHLPSFPFLLSLHYLGEAICVILNVTFSFVFNSSICLIDYDTCSNFPSYIFLYFFAFGFPPLSFPFSSYSTCLSPIFFFLRDTTLRGQIYKYHPTEWGNWVEKRPGACTEPGKWKITMPTK